MVVRKSLGQASDPEKLQQLAKNLQQQKPMQEPVPWEQLSLRQLKLVLLQRAFLNHQNFQKFTCKNQTAVVWTAPQSEMTSMKQTAMLRLVVILPLQQELSLPPIMKMPQRHGLVGNSKLVRGLIKAWNPV